MRTKKECRATRREINEALADRRPADRVVEHIAACGSCREFHDQQVRLSELVGSLQPVSAPADFDLRLRARLARQDSLRSQWFGFPRFAFGTPAVAIAAALVVLVGMLVLFKQLRVNPKGPDAEQLASRSAPPAQRVQPNVPAPIAGNQTGRTEGNVNAPKATANPQQPYRALNQVRDLKGNARAKRDEITSNDFSILPATSIKRSEADQNAAEISLSKPFKFSLLDIHGVTRKFSLPPLSFGSQQLVQRGQPDQPATYAGNRIW